MNSNLAEEIIEETTIQNSNTGVEEKIDECVKKSKVKAYDFTKRVIDIFIGLIGCILLIPLTVMVKLMNIFNGEKGKVFYSQTRIGKNGKEFKLYKHRTMVKNADEILKKILEEDEYLRNEYQINKKMRNDPRITKTGKFLRKTSIDEFPQFVNILKGDMSVVGNRPYLPREKEDMGVYYNNIVKTKPGLTGLWQTSGRSAVSFKRRLEIEKRYSEEYSLRMDLRILINTIKEVISGKGAV